MSYSRAYSTLGLPQGTLEECLALAARFRLDALEVRALAGTIELPSYLAATYGSPEALAGRLARSDGPSIRIVALDTSLRLVGAAPGDRDAFVAFLPWAQALEVPWLRVFDGGRAADGAELAEALDTVRWWEDERRRRGWTSRLMVETHDALFSSDAILRFAQAAPSVGILWDTHHTWKKGGEDPVTTWERIAAHVVHAHVKDSVSVPSARHSFSYVLPGEGEFPAGPLTARLRAEFRGTVSLEWEKLWHPYLPDLERALQTAEAKSWW